MRLVVLYRMLQSELICESKAEIKVFRQIGNVKVLVSLAMFLAEDFITAQTAPDDVRTSMNFNVGIHWKISLATIMHPRSLKLNLNFHTYSCQ